MSIVFPGVDDVIASLLRWVSMLMRLDLPTLERPMNAYSGKSVLGHMSARGLLHLNSAVLIFIFGCLCVVVFWLLYLTELEPSHGLFVEFVVEEREAF